VGAFAHELAMNLEGIFATVLQAWWPVEFGFFTLGIGTSIASV
jgi:hypothetical protein